MATYNIYRWSISSTSLVAKLTGKTSTISPHPQIVHTSNNKIYSLSTTAFVADKKLNFVQEPNAEGVSPYSRVFSNASLSVGVKTNGEAALVDSQLRESPIPELGKGVVEVALGPEHAVAVNADGEVFAQGNGQYGRLGMGNNISESGFARLEFFDSRQAQPYGKVVKVAAGGAFSAALTEKGALFLWGLNDAGQLALAEASAGDMYSSKKYPTLVPYFAREHTAIVDVACGDRHCLAVAENGVVYYWGNGDWLEPRPITLPSTYERGIKNIKKVASGNKFSFLLTEAGDLHYLGKISAGPFTKTPELTLVDPAIFGNEEVVDVAAFNDLCVAVTKATPSSTQ